MKRIHLLLSPIVCCLLLACPAADQEESTRSTQPTYDSSLISMVNAADKRNLEMLTSLLANSVDETVRAYGCEALGTMADSSSIDLLLALINDSSLKVSESAIFALGQIRNPKCVRPLLTVTHDQLQNAKWESIGKCDTEASLADSVISSIPSMQSTNGLGRYFFQVSGNPALTEGLLQRGFMTVYNSLNQEDRTYYVHGLVRSRRDLSEELVASAQEYLRTATDPDERLALIRCLKSKNAIPQLRSFNNGNALEAVNAIRTLRGLEPSKGDLLVFASHTDPQVIQTLASALSQRDDIEWGDIGALGNWKWMAARGSFETLTGLCDSAQTRAQAAYEEEDIFAYSQSVAALDQCYDQLQWLESVISENKEPYNTFALETYERAFNNGWLEKARYYSTLRFALQSGMDGAVSVSAPALSKDSIEYLKVKSTGGWESALAKLRLPAQAEAHCYVQQAMEQYGDTVANCVTEFNHPIPWEVLQGYSQSPKAVIKTTKGEFTIDLEPLRSPSAVASFLELSEQDYYDNKRFHRVVPNFVIQTGCPNGDGYGSVDYTIRSDFGLHDYRAGAVGMASIGKDTESCQWFVSHSHTPHLEGAYTIFGYVIDGMDVVQAIGMDDYIVDVQLQP